MLSVKSFCFLFLVLPATMLTCKDKSSPVKLLSAIHYADYPSGSGMSILNKKVYVIGDDASDLLIIEQDLKQRITTPVYDSIKGRIPWQQKPDYEDMTVVKKDGRNHLFLLGSGSGGPYRNTVMLYDPMKNMREVITVDTFYKRLQQFGIKDINIEGVTNFPGGMIISNRGHKRFAKNFLIFAEHKFWTNQSACEFNIALAGTVTDTSMFSGISGLEYSYKSDRLFLTVTTENTYSNFEDGEIGKSYLWIINDISSKKAYSAINPNRVIDLESVDERFKGHKIEAVSILSESRTSIELLMVSDNDDGKTMLFRLLLDK